MPREFTPPPETQRLVDALKKLMTTEEPTPDNIRTAWSVYKDILQKIATSPIDRASLAQVTSFVDIMADLALRQGTVQSNSTYDGALLAFRLDTLGFFRKGGRFFGTLSPNEISKVEAFVSKLGSVVTG